jgi:hypothetical protein
MAKRAKGWGYHTGTDKDEERSRAAAKKRSGPAMHIMTTAERRETRIPKGLRKPHASSTILD